MTYKERKLQKTIRFERDVVRAANERARRLGLPFSVVLANAAKEALLVQNKNETGDALGEMRKSVLSRLSRLEQEVGRELVGVRELLALLTRAYLNHTPIVPEDARDAASLSGRARFAQLVELLQRNLKEGVSILDESEMYDDV